MTCYLSGTPMTEAGYGTSDADFYVCRFVKQYLQQQSFNKLKFKHFYGSIN